MQVWRRRVCFNGKYKKTQLSKIDEKLEVCLRKAIQTDWEDILIGLAENYGKLDVIHRAGSKRDPLLYDDG